MRHPMKPKKTMIAAAVLSACLAGAPMAQAESENEYSGELHDAWLDGKIETAFTLNRHLNPFRIDTDVENGMVYLDGTVSSDVDRDLAGEIAKSVKGVKKVENRLQVAEQQEGEVERAADDLMQNVSDATTTAMVKTKLLANGNTKGLKINVDTNDDVVTLTGSVESAEIRDLAEQLAQNTDSVKSVNNRLEVMKDQQS